MDPVIRLFAASDRAAVRRIACDTADCGKSVERFFPDREVFADLITRYYTDYEPSSCWVGESGGVVVGYVTGCLDTVRQERLMSSSIFPRVLLKALLRGVWLHPQALAFVRLNWDVWRGHRHEPPLNLVLYPAHLHVNLAPDYRGHGLGRKLVETFAEFAGKRGSAGVHASVREDNEKGRAFFERLGFREIAEHPVVRLEKGGNVLYGIVYGMRLGKE